MKSYKAILVAKDYRKQVFNTLPASLQPYPRCIVMALTSMKGFKSWDLDATSAVGPAKFSEGEPFYMEATPGSPLPKGKC